MQQGLERDSVDELIGESEAARALLAQAEEAGAISDQDLRGTLDELDLTDTQVEDVYRALRQSLFLLVPTTAADWSQVVATYAHTHVQRHEHRQACVEKDKKCYFEVLQFGVLIY